jgi:uncharacterized protein (DUF1810 family)
MARLDRFRDGQADPYSGFAVALRELEAGRKTGHWIWYVFPQLVGLGQSMTAVHYGLADAAEAADYLRDPVLGERLVAAAVTARRHLTGSPRVGVVTLMGSVVDALKLVSCMTLFAHVSADARGRGSHPAVHRHGRARPGHPGRRSGQRIRSLRPHRGGPAVIAERRQRAGARLRSPARSRGARATNTICPRSPITATCRKARPHPRGDMPPARSRIQPIAIGPTKPPA